MEAFEPVVNRRGAMRGETSAEDGQAGDVLEEAAALLECRGVVVLDLRYAADMVPNPALPAQNLRTVVGCARTVSPACDAPCCTTLGLTVYTL